MNVNIETNTTQQLTTEQVDILARDLCGVILTPSDSGIPVCNFTTTGINAIVDNTYEDAVDALRLKGINITYTTSYIRFLDSEVLNVLLSNNVGDGTGITTALAADAGLGYGYFLNNSDITSFDEIKYFTKVLNQTVATENLFQLASNLVSLDLTELTCIPECFCDRCGSLIYFNGINGTPNTLYLPNLQRFRTSSSKYAFRSCYGLKHITSLGSVDSLRDYTFTSCTNLEDVVLPNSCTTIGFGAFLDCSKLLTINLQNVTTLNGNAFKNCGALEYFGGADSTAGVLYLPNLTSLGLEAFYKNNNLQLISSLGSITTISERAFQECAALTSITFPNGLTTIGQVAFFNCTNLVIPDLNLPNLTSIGSLAFYGTKVQTISDLGGITNIPEYCFCRCTSLTSVTIPNSVTIIYGGAFHSCSNLTGIINIPEGVTKIKFYAFMYCAALTQIIIPSSITAIDTRAFDGCSGLTSITINAVTPPTLESDVFGSTNNCPIYVPVGSVSAYQSASGWSTYASRIQAIPTT